MNYAVSEKKQDGSLRIRLAEVGEGQYEVTLDGAELTAKGPLGTLGMRFVDEVLAELVDGAVKVSPRDDTKRARSMWGMQRSLANNVIQGVARPVSSFVQRQPQRQVQARVVGVEVQGLAKEQGRVPSRALRGSELQEHLEQLVGEQIAEVLPADRTDPASRRSSSSPTTSSVASGRASPCSATPQIARRS